MSTEGMHRWTNRGYLPHFDSAFDCQSITFRLADSIPESVLLAWHREIEVGGAKAESIGIKLETYLDNGYGAVWLARPNIAVLVENTFLHFARLQRYKLHAWVVMPNHVHVLITLTGDIPLSKIVQSWKSYTASLANKILGREGRFWQPECFDRCITNQAHFWQSVTYIEENPVRAGLCSEARMWVHSSASYPLRVQDTDSTRLLVQDCPAHLSF